MTKPPRKKRSKAKPPARRRPVQPRVGGTDEREPTADSRHLKGLAGRSDTGWLGPSSLVGGARLHLVGASPVTLAELEHAELRELEHAAADEIRLPARGYVIGEPVDVVAVHFTGHPRAGQRATCNRAGGVHDVALADIAFAPGSAGARFVARYRAWLGLRVELANFDPTTPSTRPTDSGDEIVLGQPLDLMVLASNGKSLRCRMPGSSWELTLQTALRNTVPGELITLRPAKLWDHEGRHCVSGKVLGRREDATALRLTPLALYEQGEWDPSTHYWGEEDEPIEAWAAPIIARGPRPMFEMEQVLPGAEVEDFDSDPISEAADLHAVGAEPEARAMLNGALAQDLRCLDAHAHLGNLEFEARPELALRHYKLGMDIGRLSLGEGFEGVLAWGLIDNRPFLRCMHGVGLCLWRIGKTSEAAALFLEMLWLNPSDNQGARFNFAAVEAGRTWDECEAEET